MDAIRNAMVVIERTTMESEHSSGYDFVSFRISSLMSLLSEANSSSKM